MNRPAARPSLFLAILAAGLLACSAEPAERSPVADIDEADAATPDAAASDADQGTDSADDDTTMPPDAGDQDVECTPKYGKACTQDNSVIWVDSCGNPGVVFELCGSERVCENGACTQVCESHASQKCQANNLFWFDSCDQIEEVAVACDQWCQDGACVEGTLDGTWLVTAQPDSQQLGAFGMVSYGQREATVVIEGQDVTATLDIGQPPAVLTGTLEDGVLKLSGQWSEDGPPSLQHDVTFEAELTGPTVFFGVEQDTVTSGADPQGKLVWNIQGEKQ